MGNASRGHSQKDQRHFLNGSIIQLPQGGKARNKLKYLIFTHRVSFSNILSLPIIMEQSRNCAIQWPRSIRAALQSIYFISALSPLLTLPAYPSSGITAKETVVNIGTVMTCTELRQEISNKTTRISKQRIAARRFQDFESGDEIEVRVQAEELLDTKIVSGKYRVGPNSSIRLNDGKVVYRRSGDESLRDALSNYLRTTYGYQFFTIKASSPPRVDYFIKGEVPLQAFLKTKRSASASRTQDLQVTDLDTAPNSLGDFLKSRRPFTAYSDLSCIAVKRAASHETLVYDLNRAVFAGEELPYIPLYDGDIIYVPKREGDLSVAYAEAFSRTPYSSDLQISVTGWGSDPRIIESQSGKTLFEILATANVLKRGFSAKLNVYRYNSSTERFDTIRVLYPNAAMKFIPKDKDIISIGKDPWSASLATLNELTSPLIPVLSTYFFFRGVITP